MSGGNPFGDIVSIGKRALGMKEDGSTGDAPNQGAFAALQGQGINMAQEAGADYAAQQGNRTAFADQLAAGAQGKGPSLAQAQLQAAQDRGLAQQVAAAKANRAANPALAARQSAQLGAQMQQATAQNSATARLQEQQQQQQAYQNYLNSTQNARAAAIGAGTGATSAGSANIAAHETSQKGMYGNVLKTAGQMFGLGMAKGGIVPAKMSAGGVVGDDLKNVATYASGGVVEVDPSGGQSHGYDYYANMFADKSAPQSKEDADMQGKMAGKLGGKLAGMFAGTPASAVGGGMPGGSAMSAGAFMSKGGEVPGQAQVEGDSEVNDTVDAKLSPGEMVIPRSVVDAGAKEVHNFAAELLKRGQSSKTSEPKSFGAVLAAKAHMTQQLSDLDRKYGKK
jgi:hypothetical protein